VGPDEIKAVVEAGQGVDKPGEPATAATRTAKAGSPPAEGTGAPPSETTLTGMMALAEPQRSNALAQAVDSGLVVNLRSRSEAEVRQSYGQHVLVVTRQPKPYTAAHAIHMLWYRAAEIEEVAG